MSTYNTAFLSGKAELILKQALLCVAIYFVASL